MSNCPECARLSTVVDGLESEVFEMKERIRLDSVRLKSILKKSDAYAIELHDLKHPVNENGSSQN